MKVNGGRCKPYIVDEILEKAKLRLEDIHMVDDSANAKPKDHNKRKQGLAKVGHMLIQACKKYQEVWALESNSNVKNTKPKKTTKETCEAAEIEDLVGSFSAHLFM